MSHVTSAELAAGRAWLARHGLDARLYLDPTLDGLAAGALIARRAQAEPSFVSPYRRELEDGPAVIVGRGVRRVKASGPVLYVDHHPRPQKVTETAVWDDTEAGSSTLAWRMIGAPAKLTWLADLPHLPNHRELAELCLSATRLRDGPRTTAFSMLQAAHTPQEALESPEAARLAQAKLRVQTLAFEAARTMPRIGSAAALVEIDVPAAVEAQLARAWARRLSPRPVLVANRGWEFQRVAYALRVTATSQCPDVAGIPTTELAREPGLCGAGGSLSVPAFERLRRRLLE